MHGMGVAPVFFRRLAVNEFTVLSVFVVALVTTLVLNYFA